MTDRCCMCQVWSPVHGTPVWAGGLGLFLDRLGRGAVGLRLPVAHVPFILLALPDHCGRPCGRPSWACLGLPHVLQALHGLNCNEYFMAVTAMQAAVWHLAEDKILQAIPCHLTL